MSKFFDRLEQQNPDDQDGRRWLYVPYDQLHDGIGPLLTEPADELGIVMIESRDKASRRPYHKQKLALVLSNMRHFALEQAERGVAVRYVATDGGYADALQELKDELGPMRVQRPAERELREELRPLFDDGTLEELDHDGWFTSKSDFDKLGEAPWRMDTFYRRLRKRTDILMNDGSPEGGKYSHDAANRKPWKGQPEAPEEPTFEPDEITSEVCDLVAETFADHPGDLRRDRLPSTHEHAEQLWQWALDECMPHFGPYEDAMSTESTGLFHTRISQLVNMHRLLPGRVVVDVLGADIDLPSKEGFVRQVIGWREFVRHVHEATDGLRQRGGGEGDELDDNVLAGDMDLPDVYWDNDTNSGLHCLDRVVDDVWREGYSHHITRLMVLGNLGTLLGVEPRQLSDWFWAAYVDAYDWVVEPNVLAMATYGVGDLMTTKPYVAGSAYIAKMSDYCKGCAFDPKKNCPITRMYWQFLARNQERLADNNRLNLPMANLGKRSDDDKDLDQRTMQWVREKLEAGEQLLPEDAPE